MDNNAKGLDAQARKMVDDYLDAVDRALREAGKDRPERRNVTDDVEAQILDMLESRAGASPSRADVEALLAELDPPEAYAVEAATESIEVVPPGSGRFSRTAIVGACWAPLFFIFAWSLMAVHTVQVQGGNEPAPTDERQWWQWLLLFTVVPLGCVAPFGTTILGMISISQIRRSAGRLYGMGLALFDTLLFPLLALDVGIFWFWHAVGETIAKAAEKSPDTGTIVVLVLASATSLIVDFLVAQAAWRSLTQPFGGNGIAEKETPEMIRKRALLGMLALGFSLGSLVAVLLLVVFARMVERDVTFPALVLFVASQIAALVLGILSRREPIGKAAWIISAIFLTTGLVWFGLTMA